MIRNKTRDRQYRLLSISLLLVVILANILIRFAGLFTEGLYGDESFSVFHAQQTIPELYDRLLFDRNPPLYFFALHYWIKIFGLDLFYLKGLSALFSVGTAAFIFLFAKRFLSLFTASVASLFFLLSTLQLTMSHEIRAFALVGLLCMLSFYYYLAILQKPGRSKLIILSIINLLLLFTHYMSVFIPLVQFIGSFCFYKSQRKGFKYVVYSLIVSALLFMPWVKIVIDNMPEAGSFWLEIPNINDLKLVFYNLSGTLILPLLHPTIILVFSIILFLDKKRKFIVEDFNWRYFAILLLWYVLPVLADFVIAHYTPVFRLRYVVYSSLGLFLLLAYIFSSIRFHYAFKLLLVAFLLVIPIINFNPKPVESEAWREIVPTIKEMKDTKSIVLLSAWYKFRDFTFYYNIDFFRDYKNTPYLLTTDSVFLLDDTAAFRGIYYEDAERVFFVKSHQKVVDPLFTIDSFLVQNGFSFYDKFGENDLNVCLFYKTELTAYLILQSEPIEGECSGWKKNLLQNRFYFDTIIEFRNNLDYDSACTLPYGTNSKYSKSGMYSSLINSDNQYSPSLIFPWKEIPSSSIEIQFYALQEDLNEARLVLSIEDNGKSLYRKIYFLNEQIKENNKWYRYGKVDSLPEIRNENAEIKAYIWNPDKSNTYIDDISIRFIN